MTPSKKRQPPKEILPGLWHWTSYHGNISQDVHSYFVSRPGVLIDPMLPPGGLAWFKDVGAPRHILLTNRHHYRHGAEFLRAFGVRIRCHTSGRHEFVKRQNVTGFRHGERLAAGVRALKIGSLCQEETALHIPLSGGVLALGDSVIRTGNRLAFVPDWLMGDDPEAVKRGIKRAVRRLLVRKFDHLLLAHGAPWIGGAKRALRKFIQS